MTQSLHLLRNPAEMARALGDLVSLFPPAEQPSYLQTFSRLVGRADAADELVVVEARQDGRRRGAALAQLLAGRAALVFPVKVADRELGRKLLETVVQELHTRGSVVAQAILALGQTEQVTLFQMASFLAGGELVYMSAEEETFPAETPANGLEFVEVSPDDPELARVVEASYRGSLDCPLVDGWRHISDVLAGYRATGTYRPELWRLIRRRNASVGCLLLSDFPEYEQGELTYLGIDPPSRGLGLGVAASRWTLSFARRMGWRRVLLAVDAQNQPARRIYQETGFGEVTRRLLLARKL